MFSYISSSLFALAGLVTGFFIVLAAEKIAGQKCLKRGTELKEDIRFTGRPARIILAILNSGAWATVGYQMTDYFSALLVSLLITLAVIIAYIDLRIRIIPNELVLSVAIVGLIFQVAHFGLNGIISSLLCMAAILVIFTLIAYILGLDKIGAGDIKLASAMGLALGYPYIIAALLIMSLLILAYCVAGMTIGKLNSHSMFPFAPFIMLGMISSLILFIAYNSNLPLAL